MSKPPHPEDPASGRKQRILLRVERLSRVHYRLVFVIALVLVVTAAWLGSNLRLESDILRLIPEGNRKVDTFREALEDFGSIDLLLVLIEAGEGEGADEIEDFADLFAERLLERGELIEAAEYRFSPDADFLELFYENALLFLPPERLPDLADRLTDEAIRQQVAGLLLRLTSPAGAVEETLLEHDPLGLMPLFLNRLIRSRGALNVDLADGYYLSRDNRTLIMLVKPTSPSQDLDFSRELLRAIREEERQVRLEIEEDNGEAPTLTVRYGGNYAMSLEETDLIKRDVRRNLWVSLLAVSALYWLCYRRFAALLYSSIPLLVGQALTFGLAYFALQQLNAASSAFTALLMGLGTDFTIVMYARYVEERRNGRTLPEASQAMVGQTGLGVFTGAITSAGTFYAMCISQFRGLFDLGFLIGSGILLCAVAILFLLPAMIAWNEGVRKRRTDAVKKLHLQSFGFEHLIPLASRYRKTTLVLIGAATLASVGFIARIPFNDSINALRSNRTEAARVQDQIAETFGASLSYMMAIAEAGGEQAAVELTERIQRRIQPWVEDGTIGSYDSILTYLPPEQQQLEVMQAVRDAPAGEFDPERIRKTFVEGLRENGFREDAFDEYLARMERFLSPSRPVRLDDLIDRGLGRLVDRYVHRRDGKVRIVTYLFPTDRRWKRLPPPGLVEAITDGDADIIVTGTNVVVQELRSIFSREIKRAVAAGLVLVFLLLLADFRSLRLSAIAMAQLVCGVILMFGVMGLPGVDMELNYVNAFVAVMILGVGIDYSIHLVHRMHWTGGRVEPGLLETGKAVVMAALTNIAGFGTLTLGSYPALRSFGLVALIGSLTCLFTSLTLVPALMARPEKDRHGA